MIPPPSCEPPAQAVALLWIGELEVKPGAKIALAPYWSRRPSDRTPAPPACLKKVSLVGAPTVQLSRDKRSVEVSPSAAGADTAEIRAQLGGAPVVARIRVVDASTNPLPGVWRQSEIRCPEAAAGRGGEPLREFVLRADGGFSATWRPFEAYRDYWGAWTWDRASKRFTLKLEGGNRRPQAFDGEGEAELDPSGRLQVSGVSLWDPSGPGGPERCTLVFQRLRPGP